jgi:hypothetical protein
LLKFILLCHYFYFLQDESTLARDPAILSYRRSADLSNVSFDASDHRSNNSGKLSNAIPASAQNRNASNNTNHYVQRERETGIIEKLLVILTVYSSFAFLYWYCYNTAIFFE